jgi:hypothetical protein
MSSRNHFLLFPIATLGFALAAPTAVPAQNPCAAADATPSPQCQEWMKQQKLNVTCMQNPNKPECQDWLKKQQGGTRASKGLGGANTKALNRIQGSAKNSLAVQKSKKPK